MSQKTGNMELILTLLVGLCLNLSFFHSHNLWNYSELEAGHIPHHVVEEYPNCPASQHLIAGIEPPVESAVFYSPAAEAINTVKDALFTGQNSSISNKSPPLI